MERPQFGAEVFWLCTAKTRTQHDETMQAGELGHERTRKDAKTNLVTRRGKGPCQECERIEH